MRAIYEKQGAVLEGTKLRGDVTYTAQRTEDTGALQVALNGFMPFMGYFHDIAMDRYDRMLRAQVAAKKAAEAQAAAQPSASQAKMEAESEGASSDACACGNASAGITAAPSGGKPASSASIGSSNT